MEEIRVPLISVVRTEHDEKHTKIVYYSGDTVLLDMEILKSYVPSTGPVEDLLLVQLFVTPHEHMAVLGDVLARARAGLTSGAEWEALMRRVENLLVPPSR